MKWNKIQKGNRRDEENPLAVGCGYKWLCYELIFSFFNKKKYMVFWGSFSSHWCWCMVLVCILPLTHWHCVNVKFYHCLKGSLWLSIPEVKILVDLTIVLWVSFNFTFNNRIFYGSFSFFFFFYCSFAQMFKCFIFVDFVIMLLFLAFIFIIDESQTCNEFVCVCRGETERGMWRAFRDITNELEASSVTESL